MNNYEKIYWLTRLDYIQGFFIAASAVLGMMIVARILNWLFLIMEEDDEKNPIVLRSKIWRTIVVVFFILSIACACLVPSKNEAIVIFAGGKTMDYIGQDTSIQKIPFQATKFISDYLDKSLKELKDDNTKKK